jgi:hypothetical protein
LEQLLEKIENKNPAPIFEKTHPSLFTALCLGRLQIYEKKESME